MSEKKKGGRGNWSKHNEHPHSACLSLACHGPDIKCLSLVHRDNHGEFSEGLGDLPSHPEACIHWLPGPLSQQLPDKGQALDKVRRLHLASCPLAMAR